MSTNFRTSRLSAVVAASVGSIAIAATTFAPTASATVIGPSWGGVTATSAYQCKVADGIQLCTQISYNTKTKVVTAHSWAIDRAGGTNWTVDASTLKLVESVGTPPSPRKTSPSKPVMTKPEVGTERLRARTYDLDVAATRDDARITYAGHVGGYYAARATFHAKAGATTKSFTWSSGWWVRVK